MLRAAHILLHSGLVEGAQGLGHVASAEGRRPRQSRSNLVGQASPSALALGFAGALLGVGLLTIHGMRIDRLERQL
jgi:hypothetical protein